MASDETPAVAAPVHERAHSAAAALLASSPWSEFASRALLLLVRPPATSWAPESGTQQFWLIFDAPEARALPPEPRQALLQAGAYRGQVVDGFAVTVFTSEALAQAFGAVNRPSLELRWIARHGAPLHDPLHRANGLASIAGRLPVDAPERIVRPLYVEAYLALEALSAQPAGVSQGVDVVLLGEAAAALTRLACALDTGSYPPAEWLVPAARATHLGQRISAWLDDLAAAAGGEPRAARWVRESAPGVLREAASALHADFGDREWLRDPQQYALRLRR